MLQLNNITRRYNDKVAVSGVDLEIEPGTFVELSGARARESRRFCV